MSQESNFLYTVLICNSLSPILMAVLLWIGGAVAIFANMPQLGIAVFMVNIINGVFTFWQEHRAGKATDALRNMLPSYSRVIRNGEEQKILAQDLVLGDIILLEEGDKISADARLIETSDLQINQSTLTGESNPVRKTKDAVRKDDLTRAETPNLIFAGTSVSEGNGKASFRDCNQLWYILFCCSIIFSKRTRCNGFYICFRHGGCIYTGRFTSDRNLYR